MSDTSKTGGKNPAGPKGRTRRGFGLRAIAKTLPKITGQALGKRGFALADLLRDWASIVGRDIAARCVPRKLDRPRPSQRRGAHAAEGTLTLRVEAGFALEVQHLEPQLLERINGYFGFRAVTRLRLLQGPAPAPTPESAPAAPVRPEAMTALHARLEDVEDTELRGALDRLGQALLRRDA